MFKLTDTQKQCIREAYETICNEAELIGSNEDVELMFRILDTDLWVGHQILEEAKSLDEFTAIWDLERAYIYCEKWKARPRHETVHLHVCDVMAEVMYHGLRCTQL